jgi:N,N-dimethylformamidase
VPNGGRLALGETGAVHVFVQPTTPAKGPQAFVSRWDTSTEQGWWLGLIDGRVTLRLGDGTTVHETIADAPLAP